MNGFTDGQIISLRKGEAPFSGKLDAWVKTTKAIVSQKGRINEEHLNIFFEAGFTKENLIDLIVAIGENQNPKIISKNCQDIPKLSTNPLKIKSTS